MDDVFLYEKAQEHLFDLTCSVLRRDLHFQWKMDAHRQKYD